MTTFWKWLQCSEVSSLEFPESSIFNDIELPRYVMQRNAAILTVVLSICHYSSVQFVCFVRFFSLEVLLLIMSQIQALTDALSVCMLLFL